MAELEHDQAEREVDEAAVLAGERRCHQAQDLRPESTPIST